MTERWLQDYITHSCGGGGCKGGKALDLRNDTNVFFDNETYSTTLYTSEAVRMIEHHDPAKGPFFLYAAYQAVHGPLEAPQKYLDQCAHVTEDMRHIFCGMVLALDEGVGNISKALKAAGLYDNTIIALTTDNGGQNGVGGNNWCVCVWSLSVCPCPDSRAPISLMMCACNHQAAAWK